MRELIRKILLETVKEGKVTCDGCGWSWDLSDGGNDPYTCHKCGHNNTPKQKSNLNRLLEKFKNNFPEELKPKVNLIEKFVAIRGEFLLFMFEYTLPLLFSCIKN